MTAEANWHQARLYLVLGSKRMPVGGRVKRIVSSGAGWLEAERGDNAELPGNIPAKSIAPKLLACWIAGAPWAEWGEDGKWPHLEAEGKMCCALKTWHQAGYVGEGDTLLSVIP